MNALDQLKQYTTVVADTGDFQSIAQFLPQDATTNPSLILKAVQKPEYQPLFNATVQAHKGESVGDIMNHVLVTFGSEILKIIPGVCPPKWTRVCHLTPLQPWKKQRKSSLCLQKKA